MVYYKKANDMIFPSASAELTRKVMKIMMMMESMTYKISINMLA